MLVEPLQRAIWAGVVATTDEPSDPAASVDAQQLTELATVEHADFDAAKLNFEKSTD